MKTIFSKMTRISLALALALMALAGCGAQETSAAAQSAESTAAAAQESQSAASEATQAEAGEKELVIGVLMKQNADTFVKKIADAIQARGEAVGVKILMNDAEGSIEKQVSQCENLITQKVDAIILNAMDAEGSGPCVEMAKEAGIPIVECNTLTTNTDYDCYVGSDDVDAGMIQGEFLKSILPADAKICIMYGPMGQSPQIKRAEGYEKSGVMDFNVLAAQTANWKRDEAMSLAEDWLTSFTDLTAIVCQNDDMAMGAIEAVEAAGRTEVIVVGIDAIEDALIAVQEGKLACTVFQDSAGQGAGAVDIALKLAKGEPVEKEVMIPFQLVTKDNLADFMR